MCFIFLFCLAVLIGSGYTMYVYFDFSHSSDTKSYLKMAQGDYDVDLTHRYRVIVPNIAGCLAIPISKFYKSVWPQRAKSLWPLRFSFYIINSLILALSMVIIFRTSLLYNASVISSLIAVVAILTSRYAVYISGLPLIDSLYFLVFAVTIYAIKAKSKPALIFCIFIGPFAKESFIFLAPLIFFFGAIQKKYQLIYFLLSALLVFGVRSLIDIHMGITQLESINNALDHSNNIFSTLKGIFTAKGIGEIMSVIGVFNLILILGFTGGKENIKKWISYLDAPCLWLLLVVVIHILLSGEAGRMAYLASPAIVIALAVILDKHPAFNFIRKIL